MPHTTAPGSWAAQTAGIPVIRGRISRYRVQDIAQVDANLRGLAEWLRRRSASPRFGLRDIQNFRADQDTLLDRRCELMAERDARAEAAA